MAMKKFCAKAGCRNLCDISQGYCNDHNYIAEQKEADRHKQYDKSIRYKRDKKYSDFYNSSEWEKTRDYILAKYKRIDLYAYYILGQIIPATTVHHIVEVKDDWSRRLDITNLFPISDGNHKVIHALYKKDMQGTQRILMDLLRRFETEMANNMSKCVE